VTVESPEMRWCDLPDGGTPEAEVGRVVRRIGDPELPGDDRLVAIRARITLRRGTRLVRRRFTWVLVVAALLVGTTLGVAARELIAPLRARLRPSERQAPVAAATESHRRSGARAAAGRAGEAGPVPETETPPVAQLAAAPPGRRAPGMRVASAAAPRAEAPREAEALARAIRKLRRDGDARGALTTLDAYAAAFPRGELAAEADLVRVEALLAAGERAVALRLLDERADTNPRARQALLVRGELRAAVGRCAEAARDLARVLAVPPRDGLDERALFARASCLSRGHDYAAARGDLQTYLRHFPQGPHARQAAEGLRALPASP
jgi:tetratricopeptide (TPR) repeat protein